MTITTNDTRNEYTATASQTVFNYTFKIFESTDLNVYQTPAGQTPADTDLITAYTVVGEGLSAGGSITLNVAATIGDLITIVSDVPESRTTDYQFNGDFIPDTVNDDFDRVVSLAKQSQSIIGRTPQFPEATQNATGLSWEAPEVGRFIRWKSDLSGLENIQLNTAVGADNAAAISYDNSTSVLSSTDVQGALDEIGDEIGDNLDDLTLAVGVAKGAQDMGTYTGSIITDNETAKENIQELEVAVGGLDPSVSGVYTPTTSSLVNLSSASGGTTFYSRVGNIVSFSGAISIDIIISGAWNVSINVPVATNFTLATQARGACSSPESPDSAVIESTPVGNSLFITGTGTELSPQIIGFSGHYVIV